MERLAGGGRASLPLMLPLLPLLLLARLPNAEAMSRPVSAIGLLLEHGRAEVAPNSTAGHRVAPNITEVARSPGPVLPAGPLPVAGGKSEGRSTRRPSTPEHDLWSRILAARKGGPHHAPGRRVHLSGTHVSGSQLGYDTMLDWYYLVAVLLLLLMVDVAVLQSLPDTVHTNLVLLLFWHLVGLTLAAEVWLRRGPSDGEDWVTGYILELLFSVDQVYVVNLIFWALATPQRLLNKAMLLTLVGDLLGRLLLLLGLAPWLESVRVVPYAVGLWLTYSGTRQVVSRESEECDVTQHLAVRTFRTLLGSRLGEYYDEEDERIFACHKNRFCMTLLGVALVSSTLASFLLKLDVAMLKQELLADPFLDFSSAVVAAFSTRALFFVMRDAIAMLGIARYSLGVVPLLLGVEALVGRVVYVPALLSLGLVMLSTAAAACASRLHASRTQVAKIIQ